jgi:hypothetical protein
MRSLLTAVPRLGCAVMMVGMVWLMSRGIKQQGGPPAPQGSRPDADHDAQLADLRSEVERLRAQVRERDSQSDPTT